MGMMEVAGEQTEAGPQASAHLLYMTLISVLTQRQVNTMMDIYTELREVPNVMAYIVICSDR
jgi:hypothetical protein